MVIYFFLKNNLYHTQSNVNRLNESGLSKAKQNANQTRYIAIFTQNFDQWNKDITI